ncbi:MAG: flagellar hook-basal body complex protein FliE [Gemmatimonadetes bacterium]|nr:flagellar hook-basal body complex protein FliE [Gemmatimonadota bacterium]
MSDTFSIGGALASLQNGLGAAGIGGVGGAEGIGGIGGLKPRVSTAVEGPSFADTLKNALGEFSAQQDDATQKVGAFLRGEPIELHQVMAATEEAGIAVEMLVEVRNKVLEAYQTLANMQS